MSLRTRQIKPDVCTDTTLAPLPDAVQLFFVKLWLACDDAGWVEWSPTLLGAQLYPYRRNSTRERQIGEWGAVLKAAGLLRIYDCGHAQVPNLSMHQHVAGLSHQVRTVEKKHLSQCSPQTPADPREPPQTPAPSCHVMSSHVMSGHSSSIERETKKERDDWTPAVEAMARR